MQTAREGLQGALANMDEAVQQVDVRPLTDLLDGVGQPLQADGGQAASAPDSASDSAMPASTGPATDKTGDDAQGQCWLTVTGTVVCFFLNSLKTDSCLQGASHTARR